MPSKLIVVSNRIPMGDSSSGGLVVALHDVLARSGGLWVGAHPDTGSDDRTLELVGSEPYRRLAFRLSETDLKNYYLGFSNSVLWPLCHRRGDLVDHQPGFEEAYRAVNRRIALRIAELADPEDLLWVHDYHLLPLAYELRSLGVRNRIGFFLHIPFPALGDLSMLANPENFAEWISHYNLLGLQTRGDVARCLEMYRADPRAEFLPSGCVRFRDRITTIRSFPIGIDVEGFRAGLLEGEDCPFAQEKPEALIIGVDRLDYTKGLLNRFRAFGRYLETRPEGTRPCFLQIAPPSREKVQAYQDITRELEEISGHINGAYAEIDWTPIRYIHRNVERKSLARLHNMAQACLVTSLADGMNLVAKEFVAAQDPGDPGVLILSRFAGAAEDMTEALQVNPYDVEDIAAAIRQALAMPKLERVARHRACMDVVEDTESSVWAKTFLKVLGKCPLSLTEKLLTPGKDSSGTEEAESDAEVHR
ncbi:trehalose-6-phosphate synthase [Salipiger sp. PrR003]|uniref:alpha,alpha-trehalose-phosphate synthase (UDP-forming) n=1 Tax=Salipiger sp. PrR003 TaxID=2706776 RepID=UPI0013DA3D0C|nr:trehalose-6-phosphate synthase [Salipiger sp. PrR003]NDV49262.1 trehalose-6-phosphate synthase [Salipiger sp. PrR003]